MKKPVSDQIMGIKPSGIRRFFDYAADMPQAISLGVGEPDFDTPMHIRQAGIQSLLDGKTFYTSNAGLKECKSAIADFLKRKYELEYDPNHEL